MSNVVNLRQARKTKVRHEKEVVAEANRVKHGISKSAHAKHKLLAMKTIHRHEGHKLGED
jgi:hypothetical protein